MSSRYPDRITINLTQQHIDDGDRGQPLSCPIALDLAEEHQYPRVKGAIYKWAVNPGTCYSQEPWSPVYVVSRAARTWMRRFDAGRPVAPARFIFSKQTRGTA